MVLTKHGTKRVRQRVGVSKRGVERAAEKAMTQGITHEQSTGKVHQYITRLYFQHNTANNIRIWCNYVYIFCDDRLVTVFNLPPELRKPVEKMRNRMKGNAKNKNSQEG